TQIKISNLVMTGRPSVVYHGTIGREKDIAVATGVATVQRVSADEVTFRGGYGVRPEKPEPTQLEVQEVDPGVHTSFSSIHLRARLTRSSDGQGIPCRDLWFMI